MAPSVAFDNGDRFQKRYSQMSEIDEANTMDHPALQAAEMKTASSAKPAKLQLKEIRIALETATSQSSQSMKRLRLSRLAVKTLQKKAQARAISSSL